MSSAFEDDLAALRALASSVAETAPALRALGRERVARASSAAALRLADPRDPLGRKLREQLPETSGLHPKMIDWALATAVAPFTPELANLLANRMRDREDAHTFAVPPRLTVVVLAGNVFTAALRGIVMPLLAGSPVLAKASSTDDTFPRLFRQALKEVDLGIAPCLDVLSFPGGAVDLEDALFAEADAVSVYGSDSTLAQIRARLPMTTRFLPHGHGLGVAYVPAEVLTQEDATARAARNLALDVAAYDQRGCLSPHAVFVESMREDVGERFGARLADELESIAQTLPRGVLPTTFAAHQVQWRGVAAARGTLFEGDGYAVGYEGTSALRLSPGYRNVSVLACESPADFARRILPLGIHLKAVGVAGDLEYRRLLARHLPPPLCPRISELGTMQCPPLTSLADGEPPDAGLVRLLEVV